MAHCTKPKTLESTLLPELAERIGNIQARGISQKDSCEDLHENQKIWLVIGICLHNIISPILRKNVENVMTTLYTALVKSDQIDKQTYPGQLKYYSSHGVNAYYLNYVNINNNKTLGRQNPHFDYKVKDAVDLSKLFLLSNMTQYIDFDDTCDSSALLGIVINVDSFNHGIKSLAANIRSDIRNPWAHCDFTQWDSSKYSLSFNLMESLIKSMNLASSDERQTLGHLNTWKTNGLHFLSGSILGLELVKEVYKETSILAEHAQVLAMHGKAMDMRVVDISNTLKEFENIFQVLNEMKTKFEDRISILGKSILEINCKIEQQQERTRKIETIVENLTVDFSRELHAFSSELQDQMSVTENMKGSSTTGQKVIIPENIRAQHEHFIQEWKNDDVMFLLTRAASYALSSVHSNNCLVVTGSSGAGKSFILHHIALHLFYKEGYEIIPFVTGPSDIIQYFDPNKKQVFVVDDICGQDTINIQIVHLWKYHSSKLEKIFPSSFDHSKDKNVFSSAKLLISCRLHIYKDKQFRNIDLFTRNECNVLSPALSLLPEEKMLMIQQYLPNEMICHVKNLMNDFDCFPLLCRLSRGRTSEELVKLFSSPMNIIESDVNKIYLENQFQFGALTLCVLFCEGFNEKWVQLRSTPEEKRDKIFEILKELRIDLTIEYSRKSLIEGFTTLEGTYLKKTGTLYRIMHDKVYSLISVICGRFLTSCFIRYASTVFVRDHFLFKCCQKEHTDNSIVLETDMEEEYFNRLYDDLKNMDTDSTFHNKLLVYSSFRNKLINYLRLKEEAHVLLNGMNEERFLDEKANLFYRNNYCYFTNPLIEAAAEGFPDIVQILIDIDCNQDDIYKTIFTLYAACRAGNVDVVKLLLSSRLNKHSVCTNLVEIGPVFFLQLLLMACTEGHKDIVNHLLDNNSHLPKCIQYGESLLYTACEEGHKDLVNLSYTYKGANFDRCIHGQSPIYMACFKGHFDIVKIFLQNGADTSILSDRSLFAQTCKNGFTEILSFLLKNDKTTVNLDGNILLVEACRRGHTKIVEVLLENFSDTCQYELNRRLPFYIACQKGLADIVRLLLKYSMCGSQCLLNGRASLEIASEIKYEELMKMLSEYNSFAESYGYLHLGLIGNVYEKRKSSIESIFDFFSKCSKLPLQLACYMGHVEIVAVLLENNFDVNQCNSYGESAMYNACVKGHSNIIELLLEANADLFRCNKFGKSPLFVACENGHVDSVKLLLKHNAEIYPCNKSKKSPFFVACEKGHADIVRILLKTNGNVFQCDRYGRSPLYIACKEGYIEIVNILLSNNAAMFHHNKYGKSPMCVACENGHLHIVNLLLKNNFDFSHCVYNKLSLIITALGRGHIDIANILVQHNDDRSECDGFQRAPCYVVCEIDNYEITKLLTNLREEYSTQRACDTNTVEILFYSHYPEEEYELLHLYVPRLRLYTEIFNHFLKSEQQNENKTNNQE